MQREELVAGVQEFGVDLVELVDEINTEKRFLVLAVTELLAGGPLLGLLPLVWHRLGTGLLGLPAGDLDNCVPQHLSGLNSQESRMIYVGLYTRCDLLHPVLVLAVDLHRVQRDADLAGWRIDLVDHASNDVDPLDRPAKLEYSLADDRDRDLEHRIDAIGLAGDVEVGVLVRGGDLEPELALAGTVLLGLVFQGLVARLGLV